MVRLRYLRGSEFVQKRSAVKARSRANYAESTQAHFQVDDAGAADVSMRECRHGS
jgi:hypothetical protein